MQVWFDSVGRGANLILNVAADKTGRLDPADVKSLLEFKELRDKLYARDYALGATVTASQTRGNDKKFSPSNMTDGNIETYWAVEDDNLTPTAVITLPKPATFDVIRLREQTRLGQRVDSFNIDAFVNGKWVCIDNEGKTIGNQVMRRLNRPNTTQETAPAHHGQPGHSLHLGILPLPPACGRRAALHLPPRRQPRHHCGRQK